MTKDKLVEQFNCGDFKFRIMSSNVVLDHMNDKFYIVIRLPKKTNWKLIEGAFETEGGAIRQVLKCLESLLQGKDLSWPFIKE